MKWYWTWGGTSFGYRQGNDLWTHDGRHVGRFEGEAVFDRKGSYLGEVIQGDRLIRRIGINVISYGFTPYANQVAVVPYADYAGYAMYAGYEDFPSPNKLR